MGMVGGFEFVPGIHGTVVDKCGGELDGAEVAVNALALAIVDVQLENGLFRGDITVPFVLEMPGRYVWGREIMWWDLEGKGERQRES